MKKIILMRHGSYISEGLSAAGIMQVELTAEQLAADGLVPDEILHSPKRRARETAEKLRDIFKKASGRIVPLRECNILDEDADLSKKDFLKALDEKTKTVLAVSHEPTIIRLSSRMTQGWGSVVKDPRCGEANVFEADVTGWQQIQHVQRTRTIKP